MDKSEYVSTRRPRGELSIVAVLVPTAILRAVALASPLLLGVGCVSPTLQDDDDSAAEPACVEVLADWVPYDTPYPQPVPDLWFHGETYCSDPEIWLMTPTGSGEAKAGDPELYRVMPGDSLGLAPAVEIEDHDYPRVMVSGLHRVVSQWWEFYVVRPGEDPINFQGTAPFSGRVGTRVLPGSSEQWLTTLPIALQGCQFWSWCSGAMGEYCEGSEPPDSLVGASIVIEVGAEDSTGRIAEATFELPMRFTPNPSCVALDR